MKLKTILENFKNIFESENILNNAGIDYDIIYKYSPETFLNKENFKEWAEKVRNEILKITKDHFIFLKEKENFGNFVYTGCLKSKSSGSKKLLYFMFSIPKGKLEEKPILLIPSIMSKSKATMYTDLKHFLENALYLLNIK